MPFLLILLVAASRFLPHPPNVACVGAIGLFAGYYLTGRLAWGVPVLALLLSDLAGALFQVPGMGFYDPAVMLAVYLGVAAAVPVGRWASRHGGVSWVAGGSLISSTLFFLLSNFGVWAAGWYPPGSQGILTCYVNALPFFGYTVMGDLLFTTLIFGAWSLSSRRLPVAGHAFAR